MWLAQVRAALLRDPATTGPTAPSMCRNFSVSTNWRCLSLNGLPELDGGIPISYYLIQAVDFMGRLVSSIEVPSDVNVGMLRGSPPTPSTHADAVPSMRPAKLAMLRYSSHQYYSSDAPSAAHTPQLQAYQQRYVCLQWNQPGDTGGEGISGYFVSWSEDGVSGARTNPYQVVLGTQVCRL